MGLLGLQKVPQGRGSSGLYKRTSATLVGLVRSYWFNEFLQSNGPLWPPSMKTLISQKSTNSKIPENFHSPKNLPVTPKTHSNISLPPHHDTKTTNCNQIIFQSCLLIIMPISKILNLHGRYKISKFKKTFRFVRRLLLIHLKNEQAELYRSSHIPKNNSANT